MARFKNALQFGKAVLRYRSFEMRKSRYASDEGRGKSLRGLPPLATFTQVKLGAGGCMTAELEADLNARRAEAADLKAALTAWVAGAGGRKTAVGKAVRAALVAGAGGCKAAGWRPLRKFFNDKASSVVLMR